jgi:hypothetical protein
MKNFIDKEFARKYKILTTKKKQSYSLKSLSDSLIIFRVKNETQFINIKIKRHQKETIFDIIKLEKHNLILKFS